MSRIVRSVSVCASADLVTVRLLDPGGGKAFFYELCGSGGDLGGTLQAHSADSLRALAEAIARITFDPEAE